MAEAKTAIANKPAWVELSTPDPAGSRDFYSKLFGWKIEVSPDPQYGGYGMAKVGGKDAAGIGPKQNPQGPTAWGVYIGTSDADELSKKVQGAGGKVIAPVFDVGDMGKMAVFQDPSGAFISAWQPAQMAPFAQGQPNTYGWAELNARGVEQAIPFYKKVFGWSEKKTPSGQGGPRQRGTGLSQYGPTASEYWNYQRTGCFALLDCLAGKKRSYSRTRLCHPKRFRRAGGPRAIFSSPQLSRSAKRPWCGANVPGSAGMKSASACRRSLRSISKPG